MPIMLNKLTNNTIFFITRGYKIMSLLSKLSTQAKGVLNDLVDAFSDDGRTARQLIRDMGENEEKVKEALVEARSQSIMAKKKVDDKQAEIVLAKERATKAVSLGKEDLARSLLKDKKDHEATLVILQEQHTKLEAIVAMLTERFNEFQTKRTDMERRAESLELRSKVADASENAIKLTDVGKYAPSDSAAKAFERLEENISKKEARVSARSELADLGKSRSDELAELDRHGEDESIEDELAALKASVKKD